MRRLKAFFFYVLRSDGENVAFAVDVFHVFVCFFVFFQEFLMIKGV